MARSSSGQYTCPSSVPVASQDRFTCTAGDGPGADRRRTGLRDDPDRDVLQQGRRLVDRGRGLRCRAGYLLQVTVATPTTPANQRFRFLTPVIGQLLGNPAISGQASVVVQ